MRRSLPGGHDDPVVSLAHERVGNAARHGMFQRLAGTIDLDVHEEEGRLVPAVDGGGSGLSAHGQARGEGPSIAGLPSAS